MKKKYYEWKDLSFLNLTIKIKNKLKFKPSLTQININIKNK